MLMPIIWLLIFCTSYFVKLYVMDKPEYFEGLSILPRRAKVHDLPEKATRIDIDRYIKSHIIPAEHYFSMRNDYDASEDSADIFISFFMTVIPAVCLLRSIFNWLAGEKYVTIIFSCVGAAALCVILALIIHRLYKTYLAIPSLKNKYRDPVKYVNEVEDEFDVGHVKSCENNMTLIYCSYCYEIEKTMRKRIALKSVVTGICAVVYLLFFFRSPYE